MPGGYAVLILLPEGRVTLYDKERIPTPPDKLQVDGKWYVMDHPSPEEPDSANHVEARYRPGE